MAHEKEVSEMDEEDATPQPGDPSPLEIRFKAYVIRYRNELAEARRREKWQNRERIVRLFKLPKRG